jgi:lambda family phage portal protein
MKLPAFISDLFRKPKALEQKRSYNAAVLSRLNSDWLATGNSADSEIRGGVRLLRQRCRELERNNDYVRRYLKLMSNNVLGHCGIGLQMKIKERVLKDKQWVEKYDDLANNIIEDAWESWGKSATCTIGKNRTWLDVQKLALRSVVRDGAVLIRKHYPEGNKFRFALELIEIDQLDDQYFQTDKDGSITKMGIKTASTGEVVSYFILRDHPGELYKPRTMGKWVEEVPAKFIIHLYDPERVGQTAGVPWLVSAMVRLKNLGAYEEAEVIASRIGAAKMGFLIPNATATGGYVGDDDGRGNKYMEVEPGSIETLPRGYDFKAFDPTHPSTAFQQFVKATLRGISAGLGVSYTSLANDLEGVNYSSIRAGLLEEREEWKTVQQWFISWFITPIFEEWLAMAAISKALTNSESGPVLPAAKLEKWNQPEWKPRRWDWVDPLKDLQASVLAVEKGFKSRRQIIAEGGGDVQDVFSDISADDDLADQYDLDFTPESGQQSNTQPTTPDAPDDPTKMAAAGMKALMAESDNRHREMLQAIKPIPAAPVTITLSGDIIPAVVQGAREQLVESPPVVRRLTIGRNDKGEITEILSGNVAQPRPEEPPPAKLKLTMIRNEDGLITEMLREDSP